MDVAVGLVLGQSGSPELLGWRPVPVTHQLAALGVGSDLSALCSVSNTPGCER